MAYGGIKETAVFTTKGKKIIVTNTVQFPSFLICWLGAVYECFGKDKIKNKSPFGSFSIYQQRNDIQQYIVLFIQSVLCSDVYGIFIEF